MNRVGRGLALHRSNSSLELPHSPDPASRVPETPLRREYGSHGTSQIYFFYIFSENNFLCKAIHPLSLLLFNCIIRTKEYFSAHEFI